MPTIAEAFSTAVEHHRAGRLDAADALYRRILVLAPQHAEAWHLLGVVEHQRGRHDSAIELIRTRPQMADRMMATLVEQPAKISAALNKFSAEFEQLFGISRPKQG